MQNTDVAQTPAGVPIPAGCPYLTPLAAACTRSVRPAIPLPHDLAQRPLSTLTLAELQTIIAAGQTAELRLHPFKKTGGG